MKVILSADHAGMILRNEVKELLEEKGIEYEDIGCNCETSVDYPDYAVPAAERVAKGEFDLGILICGTGIGMSISANKVKGVRCALAQDVFSAKMSRMHNNANMLAMGERVTGPGPAREIAKAFLETEFEGGRHERRVNKMMEYENK
ncbi:MAG TPA: ribose 5-phosphate isomerase B [Candidatus Avamphibacillus sp.]|nr:ribose 5-phosphate isomerase B [Candidatus Avamphibacillus sp.]